MRMRGLRAVLAGCALALAAPQAAISAGWLPHPAGAEWVYEWSESGYPLPVSERVTVTHGAGPSFTLSWTTTARVEAGELALDSGTASFRETSAGLLATDWELGALSCGVPEGCRSPLAATLPLLAWWARTPALAEPLLAGATWRSTGGGDGEAASIVSYLGREAVSVPAFPEPVVAAKVQLELADGEQDGAERYRAGVRTVWWVFGVGPVKVALEQPGAEGTIVTTSLLQRTSLAPLSAPADVNYFPLEIGEKLRYSWRNDRHLPVSSVQEFSVDEVVNGRARIGVQGIAGPIRVRGNYGFAWRLDGLRSLWAVTRVSGAKLPAVGPSFRPKARRRGLSTPFDLMVFGLNPVLDAYPSSGQTWRVKPRSLDFAAFGATGSTAVLGTESVTVPAGTFEALVVRSTFRQKGFAFASGTRTSYFAPDVGLVKLLFAHGDGSVSSVELLRASKKNSTP